MAMDFAQQQRDPTRHLIGIGAVVILHVLVVWALVSGLARKVVEVVKGPIEVKVIEEIIKKPPPPPEVVPPPPEGGRRRRRRSSRRRKSTSRRRRPRRRPSRP